MVWQQVPLDRIYFDEGVGVPGTVWPIGTPEVPSDVIADVITMCAARNLHMIAVHGALTLGAAMEHYCFFGYEHYDIADIVNLNGQNMAGSTMDRLIVTGALGTGLLALVDCVISAVTLFAGRMNNCSFYASACSFRDASFIDLVNCESIYGAVTINVQAPTRASIKDWRGNLILTTQDGGLCYVRGFKGSLEIDEMTGGTLNVYANGADITINADCTGGAINVWGNARVTGAGGGVVITNYTVFDDATNGLAAIKAEVEGLAGAAMRGTDGAALVADGWDAALATILDNFTALRIGYLEELDFDLQGALNTIAGYIDTEVGAIITSQGRMLFTMDFWSIPQEEVAVVVAAGDKALPSVTVAELPAGATIVRAIAMFKFRMIENHTYAGENKLDGAQEIQVAASVDAINFVDGQFTLAETTREGGDVVIGLIDIAATVNANGAYAFHWDLAKAIQTGINFNDVQMGIRIWYSV